MQRKLSYSLAALLASATLLLLVTLARSGTSAAQDVPPPEMYQIAALPTPDHDCSDGYCVFEVITSTDDAGPHPTGCTFSTNSNEVHFGRCSNGPYMVTGFRFATVTLPYNAVIGRAYLLFTVDGTYTLPLTVTLYGEHSTDAAPFSAASQPVSRTRISGVSTTWIITDTWYSGQSRQTPDVTAVVQAIVNQAGWQSGNALAILAETADTGLNPGDHRRVFAYDRQKNTDNTARLVVYALTRKVYLPLVMRQ